jgi:hypothetical protein
MAAGPVPFQSKSLLNDDDDANPANQLSTISRASRAHIPSWCDSMTEADRARGEELQPFHPRNKKYFKWNKTF